jgi:hypothetical protein
LLAFLMPVLVGCESSRPPVPRNPIARHHARLEGTKMMEAACEAHGGYRIWKHKTDVTFRLADRWRGMAGRWIRPWPGEQAVGEFQARLYEGFGKVEISDERGKLSYGLGPLGPWAMVDGQMSQDKDDLETASAVIPTYLFFFEMPFSFLEYEAVHHYLGVKPAPPGGPVHEVLVTYPWYEGDVSEDWFVARFDTATMLLRSVTYTATRLGPSLIEYTDTVGGYVEIDSLHIPTRHVIRMSRPFRPGLHRWQVRDIRFNEVLSDSLFMGPMGLTGA